MAVVYATKTTSNGTVQHRRVLRTRTGGKTTEENKFFDPGGKQAFVPCRQDRFLYSGGLERALRTVLLCFVGLEVFSFVERFRRDYDLGTISNTVSTNKSFSLSCKKYTSS